MILVTSFFQIVSSCLHNCDVFSRWMIGVISIIAIVSRINVDASSYEVSAADCQLQDILSGKTSPFVDSCKKAIYSNHGLDILPHLKKCNLEVQLLRLENVFKDEKYTTITDGELLPNLVGIGVQKGGTSAYHFYLSKHKEVCSVKGKERHYFDQCLPNGAQDYMKSFLNMSSTTCKYRLEVSPEYIFLPDAACLMSIVIPEVKVILALRDPIMRFMSQYTMDAHRLQEYPYLAFLNNASFDSLVDPSIAELERENCTFQHSNYYDISSWYRCFGCKSQLRGQKHRQYDRKNVDYKFRLPSMISRGMYLVQIKWWLQFFDKSQMLIVDSHQLRKETQKNMKEIFEQLQLEDITEEIKAKLTPVHVTQRPQPYDVEQVGNGLQKLHDFFHPQVVELKDFLVAQFGEQWESIEEWPSYNQSFSAEDFLKDFN